MASQRVGLMQLRQLLVAALLAGLLPAGAPHGAESASDEGIRIEVTDGLLSVTLGEVALQPVLEAIAEQAGLQLKTRGELGTVRPQAFEGQPLAEGIRRVVGDNRINLMLSYETASDGGRHLVGVRAYGAREASRPTSARQVQRNWGPPTRRPPPPVPPPPAPIPPPG